MQTSSSQFWLDQGQLGSVVKYMTPNLFRTSECVVLIFVQCKQSINPANFWVYGRIIGGVKENLFSHVDNETTGRERKPTLSFFVPWNRAWIQLSTVPFSHRRLSRVIEGDSNVSFEAAVFLYNIYTAIKDSNQRNSSNKLIASWQAPKSVW